MTESSNNDGKAKYYQDDGKMHIKNQVKKFRDQENEGKHKLSNTYYKNNYQVSPYNVNQNM